MGAIQPHSFSPTAELSLLTAELLPYLCVGEGQLSQQVLRALGLFLPLLPPTRFFRTLHLFHLLLLFTSCEPQNFVC